MKNKSKKTSKKNNNFIIMLLMIGAIPVVLFVLGIIAAVFLAAVNPQLQIEKGRCVKACSEQYTKASPEYTQCMNSCAQMK